MGLLITALLLGYFIFSVFLERKERTTSPPKPPPAEKEEAPPIKKDLIPEEWEALEDQPEEFKIYDLAHYQWEAVPRLSEEHQQEIIKHLKEIPPPRILSVKLYQLLNDPEASVKEISKLISLDPILTGQILRIANSAYYRPSGAKKITSIHRAIVLLGYNQLRIILIHYFLKKVVSKHSPLPEEEVREIWKHSVEVSTLMSYFAMRYGYDVGTYITAGILHDLGKFFLPLFLPQDGIHCMASPGEDGLPPLKEEELRYGFTHTVLGAMVVKNWELPQEIYAAVAYHHPHSRVNFLDLPPHERKIAGWIMIADYISRVYGNLSSKYAYRVPPWVYQVLGIKGPVERLINDEVLQHMRKASLALETL